MTSATGGKAKKAFAQEGAGFSLGPFAAFLKERAGLCLEDQTRAMPLGTGWSACGDALAIDWRNDIRPLPGSGGGLWV